MNAECQKCGGEVREDGACSACAAKPKPSTVDDLHAAILAVRATPRLRVFVQTDDDLELLLARLRVRREPARPPLPGVGFRGSFYDIPIEVSSFVPAGKIVVITGDFPNAKVRVLDLHAPEAA